MHLSSNKLDLIRCEFETVDIDNNIIQFIMTLKKIDVGCFYLFLY